MKYIAFLSVLFFSSVGCAATFHSPYYVYDDCEYEYVYVPAKKIVTVYGPGYHHGYSHHHKSSYRVVKYGASHPKYKKHKSYKKYKAHPYKKVYKKKVYSHKHH